MKILYSSSWFCTELYDFVTVAGMLFINILGTCNIWVARYFVGLLFWNFYRNNELLYKNCVINNFLNVCLKMVLLTILQYVFRTTHIIDNLMLSVYSLRNLKFHRIYYFFSFLVYWFHMWMFETVSMKVLGLNSGRFKSLL